MIYNNTLYYYLFINYFYVHHPKYITRATIAVNTALSGLSQEVNPLLLLFPPLNLFTFIYPRASTGNFFGVLISNETGCSR